MVRHLSRDDAQIFVDTIDHPKVSLCHSSTSKERVKWISLKLSPLSNRHWIAWNHRFAGGVYVLYAGFVAAKSCSRDHSRFRFVMTQQRPQCAVVDAGMCGKVNMKAGRSQSRF